MTMNRISPWCQAPRAGLNPILTKRRFILTNVRSVGREPAHVSKHICSARHSDDEKSWSEIGEEIAEVAKDVGGKVWGGLTKAVESVVPGHREKPMSSYDGSLEEFDKVLKEAFGGGFIGNIMSSAFKNSPLAAVAKEMRDASEQSEDVQFRAASIIEEDGRLRSLLGSDISVGQPITIQKSGNFINGERVMLFKLVLPVMGSRGSARAVVESDGREIDIEIRLADGSLISLDGLKAGGKTIDVEID